MCFSTNEATVWSIALAKRLDSRHLPAVGAVSLCPGPAVVLARYEPVNKE